MRSCAVRRLAVTIVAVALAALLVTDVGSRAGATSPAAPTANSDETCVQPDCFAAIAFNPSTGAWGATKNFPTREQAASEAVKLCRSVGERPRQCEALVTARGEQCIGAAMRVRDGEILGHTTARAEKRRAAWQQAVEDLSGRQEFRHRITAICNG